MTSKSTLFSVFPSVFALLSLVRCLDASAQTGTVIGYPQAKDCMEVAASHGAGINAAREACSACVLSADFNASQSDPRFHDDAPRNYTHVWARSCIPMAMAVCTAEDA